MRSRAVNIQAAADHAIYTDDPDAIEALRERIATLEKPNGQPSRRRTPHIAPHTGRNSKA
jgi:hypothetical protein